MVKSILQGLNQKPVSYYKVYTEVTGSTVAGIMLSQLMYWFSVMNKDMIYKIDEDFVEELDLSDGEIRGAKKLLKQLDFLTIDRAGVPARTYYRIDWDLLYVAIGKANKRMIEKREQRALQRQIKAEKRANEAHSFTVGLNSPNKMGVGEPSCLVNSVEPVRSIVQNRVGQIDRTHLCTENTTENTTERVLFFLNGILGTNYKQSKDLELLIIKKFTAEQIEEVIRKKHEDWWNTDMEQYLRPSTLFGNKFEEYLNAESKKQRKKREVFVGNLFRKFKSSVETIKNKNLQIKDLKNIKWNFNNLFNNEDMKLLSSYNSMELLLSLFMQGELELDLLKRSSHVCK
jgi:uncharacterized phage protein (TIGR02220 family)